MPMLSIALSKVLPIRNSNDKSAINIYPQETGTINSFWVLCSIRLMSFIPRNKQSISHGQRRPMICRKIIKIVHTPRQSRIDMSHHFTLKVLFGLKFMEREGFPQSTSFRRDTRSKNFDFFFSIASGRTRMVTRTDGHACLRKSVDTHDGLEVGGVSADVFVE